jgi:hypothetical protein
VKQPRTRAEWQEAVDAAHALLCLDSARKYRLVTAGPEVDVDRCQEILSAGRNLLGIRPAPDCVERLIAELPTRARP